MLKNKKNIINMRDAYRAFDSLRVIQSEAQKAKYKNLIDSLYKICDSLMVEIDKLELKILEKPTYSKVWMQKLLGQAKTFNSMKDNYPDYESLVSIYNNLSDEQKNTEIGKKITSYLFPPTIVKEGEKMADADLINIEGKKENLADYTNKYRLLDFWSIGCDPCIAAIPEMKEIAEKYKDQLVVIGINSDSQQIWEDFSSKNETADINLNDPNGETGLKLNYGIKGIPHYVLVASNDTIISTWTGYGKGSLLSRMSELIK